MKILITGHCGFIGSYLSEELKKNNLDFIGIDLKEGNDILTCELPNNIDLVIHLAAQTGVIKSVEKPLWTAETNILGTIRLAEYYKKSKFIFPSSGGAIQDKIISPYGLSKYCCEEFIKMICEDYIILRLPNVYGLGSRSVIDKFLTDDIVIYGDGSAKRTYVFIEDIISGILTAIDWETGLYKLGGNQNYTVLQIAEAIGKPIKFLNWRKGELRNSSLENTTPNWQTTLDAMDYIKSVCQKT